MLVLLMRPPTLCSHCETILVLAIFNFGCVRPSASPVEPLMRSVDAICKMVASLAVMVQVRRRVVIPFVDYLSILVMVAFLS